MGEVQGWGSRSQVTFSRESSCKHSAPGKRVTVKSSVFYKPKPRFSHTAFTLHRSTITKPIKKPRSRVHTISESPLFDLATRITAQQNSFQHRINRIPASPKEYLYSFSPFQRTHVVTRKATFNLSQKHTSPAHWNNGCNITTSIQRINCNNLCRPWVGFCCFSFCNEVVFSVMYVFTT